jgi:Spy/CpxP family protein refolding chaperone
MLERRMGFDKATARRVATILGKYDSRRRALRQKLRTHHRKLVQLVKADGNDQAAYRREIQALKRARLEMQRLRDREFTELQGVLTPKQQAKMLVRLGQFRRGGHMERPRRGKHGRRGRRGMGRGNF